MSDDVPPTTPHGKKKTRGKKPPHRSDVGFDHLGNRFGFQGIKPQDIAESDRIKRTKAKLITFAPTDLPGETTQTDLVQTPIGWEGYPPRKEIANLKLLVEWIDLKLVALEAWRKVTEEKPKIRIDMGADVRNAHHVLAHLGIVHTFPLPAQSQRMTLDEAEAHFMNLRNLCMGRPKEKLL
jgi:hypothetical protein